MPARLDRLEEAGYVVRKPDPDDRRGLLVELSPTGFALIDKLVMEHLANEERVLAALSPEQRQGLGDLLRELLVSLEAGV
jgi:DNA-binding MarR family transcriptional regulator